jgi:hypothetical protein
MLTELLVQHPDWVVNENDQLMDEKEFSSEMVQRVFQTLQCYEDDPDLKSVDPATRRGTPEQCIDFLQR